MSRIILHIDMDAFFAAIEQLDHPEYLGKPVIVGADPKGGTGRGVVSTCSYEARRFGIHSAMPISRAYRLCPQGIYVSVRGKRYSEMSRRIMKLLEEFSPDIEPISIDEAFLDITSTVNIFGPPPVLGKVIKERIYSQTGLTASVGIAPNKFLAKIASDLEKPDGLVIVSEDRIQEFLNPLPISKLWGVGEKTRPHLERMGVRTIGDLAAIPQKKLIERFGKTGLHFWRLAHGLDQRSVEDRIQAKSVSEERTFEKDIDNEAEMRNVIYRLCDDVARILRKRKFQGRTVHLKIRLQDFSTYTRSRTLSRGVDTSEAIHAAAEDMFNHFDLRGQKVRLLGVGVSSLENSKRAQLDLFTEEKSNDDRVDRLIDELREKFGDGAVTRASLTPGQNLRPGNPFIRDHSDRDS
jgi:DNA polymerase-4